jgi:DNA-binding transcriptional regulator YiaG
VGKTEEVSSRGDRDFQEYAKVVQLVDFPIQSMPLSPEQVKKIRKRAGLTQSEAARLVHVALRTWQTWETSHDLPNGRPIPEGYLELFCIKVGIGYPPSVKNSP